MIRGENIKMTKTRKVYPLKNGRFSIMEKDSNKRGFGSVKIIANVGTRAEANDIRKCRR